MGMGRKLVVAALAALGILGINSGAANAQILRPLTTAQSPSFTYLFAEYDYYSATGGSANGGGIGAGWRINRWLGIQGAGQYTARSGVNMYNGYVEAMLLLPIGNRLSFYGSAGAAYSHASTRVLGVTVSADGSGYRAGVGMEYWMSSRWSLRLGAHRQNAGGVVDNYSAGVGFRF
jgi:opacity protein-like surface antigen